MSNKDRLFDMATTDPNRDMSRGVGSDDVCYGVNVSERSEE